MPISMDLQQGTLFLGGRICRKLWFIYVYLVSECVMLSPKFSGLEWFRFNLRTFRWFPVVSCSFSQASNHLGTITIHRFPGWSSSLPLRNNLHMEHWVPNGSAGGSPEKMGSTWDRSCRMKPHSQVFHM